MQLVSEVVWRERLGQERDGPLQVWHAWQLHGAARHHDDAQALVAPRNRGRQVEACHARHRDVRQQDVDAVSLRGDSERRPARLRLQDPERVPSGNLLGLPGAVVPVGRSPEGLPIGVQVVGRPFEEELVLAVAARVEKAGGWQEPPLGKSSQ